MDKASICISCMLSHALNTFFLMHAMLVGNLKLFLKRYDIP